MSEIPENTVDRRPLPVLHKIGSGGMADVYCAEDTHLGRRIAMKLLHRRFAQDTEFVERFRREASSAAGLQHPNVVGVYDRGEFDDTYYIAMEYCEGRSLKDVIRAEAPLDVRRAIAITKQILLAARFAHRRNVIHRDLKPHNVILDDEDDAEGDRLRHRARRRLRHHPGGRDHGNRAVPLARAGAGPAGDARPPTSTRSGSCSSSFSPGKAPFDGESAVAIALKHVNQPPPSPRSLVAGDPA